MGNILTALIDIESMRNTIAKKTKPNTKPKPKPKAKKGKKYV